MVARGGTVKPAAERVQTELQVLGLDRKVIELAVSARTSREAADALGVQVGQIAKSLVFTVDGAPVLVVASGANRVDEDKLGRLAGGRVKRAAPEIVRAVTGYAIGGVPPLAHQSPLPIYIDQDLGRYDVVYAAAGVPECVFPITAAELARVTGGRVADVREEPGGPAGGAR
ncbi:MAG TPA: YbaK/EbsC family protein [Candidatus Limnocylindrales bacterium]|nr:YbaK/EbsC family protein [Candidatus Limnocylindrales bacterium]